MNDSSNPFLVSNTFNGDPSIENIHNSNEGKVSNKWSSYLKYYDNLLRPLKDDEIKLLEIGIQNGGSLDTWGKYFSKAIKIVGCDIDEKCKLLNYEDPRIKVVVGDANANEIYQRLATDGPYDVIIDDGSHLSEDIFINFLNYFPILKPGGIYIVEDTHAVYWRTATNIHNKKNVFAFFKDLTDVINYEFWHKDQTIENLLGSYLTMPIPAFLKEGWIQSIEFRNSIITVRKSNESNHHKLGQMTITGTVADVDFEPLRIKKIMKD